jgi:hypothetical protein
LWVFLSFSLSQLSLPSKNRFANLPGEQNGNEIKDPRELAEHAHLTIGVSAKIYHDDGSKTYEKYPEVVDEIKANASATAGV